MSVEIIAVNVAIGLINEGVEHNTLILMRIERVLTHIFISLWVGTVNFQHNFVEWKNFIYI